jgi:hypothetical protein
MTVVAWRLKGAELQREIPGITRDTFLYNLTRASYESEWGPDYQKPGIGTKIATFLFRIIPKIGPLKFLAFRLPTPEIEKMFMASFNSTVDDYRTRLAQLNAEQLRLLNTNFDTGEPALAGKYAGADKAYDKLLGKLADHHFDQASGELRGHILAYYRDRQSTPSLFEVSVDERTKIEDYLALLRSAN